MKTGNSANFANLVNLFVKVCEWLVAAFQLRRISFLPLRLVGLEDSTAPYGHARLKLANLANFKTFKNACKKGTWPTLPTFFENAY